MPNEHRSNEIRRTIRRRGRLRLILIGVGIAALMIGILWAAGISWDRRSADERLAEIEAGRAVPDAANAAILYEQLLQDPNARSLLDNSPDSLVEEVQGHALYEPWLSEDHPELSAWVRGHQYLIDRLLDASHFEQCRFPISIDVANWHQMERVPPMRKWAFLLSLAANNDVGEGRTEAAITKWQCLIQMANHLCQQPDLIDHLLAYHVEELASGPLTRLVVTGTLTETYLHEIEAMPFPVEDRWPEYERDIRLIDSLMMKKLTEGLGPWEYLKYRLMSHRMNHVIGATIGNESPLKTASPIYRRRLAVARGIRILAALRRYKDVNDRWPGSLDEIRSSLPGEALTDPVNKGRFAYRLMADEFRLYSTGENGLDEDGEWASGAGDDWPIWPPRERSTEPEQGEP